MGANVTQIASLDVSALPFGLPFILQSSPPIGLQGVTDVMMPGLNGIDTAKEILKLLPQCRIILFSGHAASAELLNEAKKEGFEFEILAKPVNPDRLLSMLVGGRFSAVQTD